MKKIILIGPRGVGKTSLMQRLRKIPLSYKKTQATEYYDNIIDTPGEFIQYRQYYNALQMMSNEVDIVCLCISVEDSVNSFPPNFSESLSKPSIGIVTHIDMIENENQLIRAHEQLELIGVEKIFDISSVTKEGINELRKYLSKENENITLD